MEREKRLDLIKLLLKNNKISTVRELAEIMEEQYNLIFSMTIVAKDLQHLRVTKVPNGSAPSYYVLPEKNEANSFREAFKKYRDDSINSIIVKDSYILIKTEPGFARTINYCIDQMQLPHVLGTVSGNDVIMMLMKSNEEAEYVKYLLLKP